MTAAPASGAPAATRIPVQLKRRHRALFAQQLVQHAPVLLTIITAGATGLSTERAGAGLALAVVELAVGAWVLASIAREARHLFGRHAASHAGGAAHTALADVPWVDWPGVAAAALAFVEVWHHAHATGRFKLVSPLVLSATVTLALALGLRRLIASRTRHRRPHLLVSTEALTYRGTRWGRWTAPWDDVAAVEHGADALVVRLRDGRTHTIRAADHLGGAGLLAAARDAVAAHAPARLTAGAGPPR